MWCLSLYCSYPASYSNCSIFGWWKLDCLLIHFDITVVFFASFLVFWYYRMFHTQQKLFWGTLGKLCALFWILGCIFWNCYFIKYLAAWKNPYNDFMMLIFFFWKQRIFKEIWDKERKQMIHNNPSLKCCIQPEICSPHSSFAAFQWEQKHLDQDWFFSWQLTK